jgi:hypothetical protein
VSVSRALAQVRGRFPEPGPAGLVERAAITVQLIKYLWHILVLLGRPAC